jgi:hypothetical protein
MGGTYRLIGDLHLETLVTIIAKCSSIPAISLLPKSIQGRQIVRKEISELDAGDHVYLEGTGSLQGLLCMNASKLKLPTGLSFVQLKKYAEEQGYQVTLLNEGLRSAEAIDASMNLDTKIANLKSKYMRSIAKPVRSLNDLFRGFLHTLSENAWIEKLMDGGPGLVVVGTNHLTRLCELLEDRDCKYTIAHYSHFL